MASASPSCNIYFFSTFTDKINNIAADNKINISDEAFALIYIIIIVQLYGYDLGQGQFCYYIYIFISFMHEGVQVRVRDYCRLHMIRGSAEQMVKKNIFYINKNILLFKNTTYTRKYFNYYIYSKLYIAYLVGLQNFQFITKQQFKLLLKTANKELR